MNEKSFLVSDESVNDLGFRVLTSGIDLTRFEKNPVMLYGHIRNNEVSGEPLLPIGTWKNLRKENRELLGVPAFDMDDPFARKIARKVDNGFLKAASIQIAALEFSEDRALFVPGQTLPTVVRCELIEISICDIPSNRNAVKLANRNDVMAYANISLSINTEGTQLSKIKARKLNANSKVTDEDMKAAHDLFKDLQRANKLTDLRDCDINTFEYLVAQFKNYHNSVVNTVRR